MTRRHRGERFGVFEGVRRRAGRRRLWLAAAAVQLAWAGAPGQAWAQRTTDSAVAKAEDAFGAAVGIETVGIYTETDVRGFNPQKAGNARLDEVYFDHYAQITQRARSSYAIRVGITAAGDASPAPSGIVAYRLRSPGDQFRATAGSNFGTDKGGFLEFDVEVPIVRDHLSVAAGVARGLPHYPDGADYKNAVFAVAPRVRFGSVEIRPFVTGLLSRDAHTRPVITTNGGYLPPPTPLRRYLGQPWAQNANDNLNGGVIGHAQLSPSLVVRGGFVQSRIDRKHNFTELFAVRDPGGLSTHLLLADPRQDSYANSWNVHLAWRHGDGDLRQTVYADVRNRHRHIESGGSQLFNYGDVRLGALDPEPEPAFAFGPVTVGTLDQRSYTLGYKAGFRDRLQVNFGVTRSRYSAETRGAAGASRSSASPWLYNAALLVRPDPRLTLYAGYVSGLEDTGSAPENAANRNQQLPASRTRQIDAGIQWSAGRMRLVATVFEMRRPYFSFDAAGRYVELADLRQRGVEISASGDPTPDLHILAGAVLMDPKVTGPARGLGLVGPRPVGVSRIHARLDGTWRIEPLWGAKLTFALTHDSPRAASSAGYATLGGRQLMLPARTIVDLGIRRNFVISGTPLSVRFVVSNVFDVRSWKTLAPNTFQLDDTRKANLFLLADF